MAVPKRKLSRSNTHSRRSQWKAKHINLVSVITDGTQFMIPRRLLRAVRLGLIKLKK